MGFGTEILFALMLGLLILGPKRLHTMLVRVARAKAQLENTALAMKSQFSEELEATSELRKIDCAQVPDGNVEL
jgi:Sec-independent protein translocase protein TatA